MKVTTEALLGEHHRGLRASLVAWDSERSPDAEPLAAEGPELRALHRENAVARLLQIDPHLFQRRAHRLQLPQPVHQRRRGRRLRRRRYPSRGAATCACSCCVAINSNASCRLLHSPWGICATYCRN